MVHGAFLPGVRINIFVVFFMESNLVVPMRMARRINDAGVVSSIGQHKSYIGVGQHLNFITERHGATWSVSVLTAKRRIRISRNETARPPTS